ncbi:conserved hypothetical protein [uncultured Pleomorphomonas sp.]|uniref:DUF1320 domain-containing protein n=2 Tax=Pleomorphomonas TaxID=261933 RepID=A0A2G9WV47_9HYPH|nr:phage protein Gp36 family protein [Pleomorphomonas carboxyditropha]PIO98586.1 hypothetical protein CJ014_14810 [Pleomorphomonas carboxyditropha]SCM75437.1 conserved hypothetical protein [uncultured Pleomorphomonas sp.]
MTAYATLADLTERHPQEVILLGADETTGVLDEVRVARALDDASIEARTILQGRYTRSELDRLDADGLAILKIYVMDIALYKVALSFSRLTDDIRERNQAAVKRLEAIVAGKGALTFEGSGATEDGISVGDASPQTVLVDAPERVFTRARLGRAGLP